MQGRLVRFVSEEQRCLPSTRLALPLGRLLPKTVSPWSMSEEVRKQGRPATPPSCAPHGRIKDCTKVCSMCLLSVKEEPDYSVPVRVKSVQRTRRSYPPPYSRTARYSSTRVVEERRPSSYNIPPPTSVPLPPPPPSYSAGPPPDPPAPPSAHYSSTKVETRQTSRTPSLRQSTIVVETEPTRSPTQTAYVEVSHAASSSSSSSSSSSEDVRSRSTRKTSTTPKSAMTRKSSTSRTTAPASEYSEHEKEFRRERTYSSPRPIGEYETYQYVNAPRDYGRRGDYDGPRASRGSYGRGSGRF